MLHVGQLTQEQAAAIYAEGREAVIFALLALSARAMKSANPSPSTPSGMIPLYQKPSKPHRKKKPGRKKDHPGSRRPPPARIDQRKKHILENCPECGTSLGPPSEYRTRIIEDIPEDIQPIVTEHTIPRAYCPTCNKIVEPQVEDALPRAMIGNHLLALSAWLHYGLGNTLSQMIAVLSCHLHFQLTKGALVNMWHRLANILDGWYTAIAEEARNSAVLHADETGWRVCGKTYWLWCFTNKSITFYTIDRSRGSPVLKRFFEQEFTGTLITDFWGAYNRLKVAARQVCLVHLFREMEKTEQYRDTSKDWPRFRKKLRRLMRDALRLGRREDIGIKKFTSLKERLNLRMDKILNRAWENINARRLIKRLRRHRGDIFTFLDQKDVPSNNNHAEREIRPAVIIRKNIFGNRSQNGAHTQAVLMSVYRTLKLRNYDPIKTIASAVATYIRTGNLPPLPD